MDLVLSSSICLKAFRMPPNSVSTQTLKWARVSAPTGSNSSTEAVPDSSLSKALHKSFASRENPSFAASRRNLTFAIDIASFTVRSCLQARMRLPCFLRMNVLKFSKHFATTKGLVPCRDFSANHCCDFCFAILFFFARLSSMPNQSSPGPSRSAWRSISSVASRKVIQISSRSLSSPGQPELIMPRRNSTLESASTLGFFLLVSGIERSSMAVAKAESCCRKSSELEKRFTQNFRNCRHFLSLSKSISSRVISPDASLSKRLKSLKVSPM
mmetsp:Transcript_53181/g.124761  ORF Transcript_53181/g.124761 Transcript_53181/m.124761 type:complete len:271 (+) Transcript_53181:805-1617(+)